MELTPDFSIVINGGMDFPKERLIDIQTNDQAGIVSDSCEFELDDFDNALQMPNTEAKIELSLGYKETGLTKIGTYFVKEIFIDGARRLVRIKANAACKAMMSQKTKTNEGSLSDIVANVAGDLGLDGVVDSVLGNEDLTDDAQFGESDINYLTRVANKVGGVVKPIDGHLVFANDMSAKSTSGQQLPTKYIDASEVSNYTCSFKETETGGGTGTIYANWFDKKTGEYHLIHVGSGDPQTELNEIFATEKEAQAAASSRLKKVTKNNTVFRFSISGRPDLFAESPLILQNFNPKIPTKWIIGSVRHSFSKSGFTTEVECNQS